LTEKSQTSILRQRRSQGIPGRASQLALAPLIAVVLLVLSAATTPSAALAQAGEPVASFAGNSTIRYVVQAGDTLGRLASKYGVAVKDLVVLNSIKNPDLIYVGQILLIPAPAGPVPTPTPQPSGGPLTFTWSLVDWQPADPNYIATVSVQVQGGTPPYTYYHDGLVQTGSTFRVVWKRCVPKPGSIGVADGTGTYVKQDYWLESPYCPVGVEIVEPTEDQHLTNMPRNFNVVWKPTVDPAPGMYGMDIEVWQNGQWQAWQTYEKFQGKRFFVPGPFPGDLGGRVRMWSIYDGKYPGPKADWRYFQFRVTY